MPCSGWFLGCVHSLDQVLQVLHAVEVLRVDAPPGGITLRQVAEGEVVHDAEHLSCGIPGVVLALDKDVGCRAKVVLVAQGLRAAGQVKMLV